MPRSRTPKKVNSSRRVIPGLALSTVAAHHAWSLGSKVLLLLVLNSLVLAVIMCGAVALRLV